MNNKNGDVEEISQNLFYITLSETQKATNNTSDSWSLESDPNPGFSNMNPSVLNIDHSRNAGVVSRRPKLATVIAKNMHSNGDHLNSHLSQTTLWHLMAVQKG